MLSIYCKIQNVAFPFDHWTQVQFPMTTSGVCVQLADHEVLDAEDILEIHTNSAQCHFLLCNPNGC